MITQVANRYANALINSKLSKQELDVVIDDLEKISYAFKFKKFFHIIDTVKEEDRVINFLSLLASKNKNLEIFLKILFRKKRLNILPQVYQSLKLNKSLNESKYEGVVFSKDKIESSELKALEDNISKKLNKNIHLTYQQDSYSGIRASIDVLNVEISFSREQIKSKMINHILQAI